MTAGDPPDPLHVRLATPADGAACAAIYEPYVATTSVSFELEAPTGDEMADRIVGTVARSPWVVVELGGVVRSYAYGTRHRDRAAYDWTIETTVYVDRDLRGRGLGRAAMRALVAVLRLQGFHLAVAGITAPNPGSVALHRSLGFERIGEFGAMGWKLDAWHGVEWFALELSSRDPIPDPVIPLPDLVGTPELAAALGGHGGA
ncbi:MAG: N-acetyltransferase family protein [Candidatus Limnocylindrales bacterium]